MNQPNNSFWAFISYSHRDSDWGDWLHKKLESFSIPKALQGQDNQLKKHLYPIFRDREELPGSADLGTNISEALASSRNLLLICSPRSAKSLWVNEEIINYQKLSPGKPIIALLVDGDDQNPQRDDFCLPPALVELRKTGQCIEIDARKKGKSAQLILQLIAELAARPLAELEALTNKRIRQTRALMTLSGMVLLMVSFWVWQSMQSAKQGEKIALAENQAIIAEQAFKEGDDRKAIQFSLAALEESRADSEFPVNQKAVAVLNQLMSQSLLTFELTRMQSPVIEILATPNNRYWLLLDQSSSIHLFDLKSQSLLWSKNVDKLIKAEINNAGNLIVRTETELLNLQVMTGQANCNITLDSQPEIFESAGLGWLKKNWALESMGYRDPNSNLYYPQQIQWLNTENCSTTELVPLGFASAVDLIDSLDDSWIIAVDHYQDGPVVTFQQWFKDPDKQAKALFQLNGQLSLPIANYHNSLNYDGPLIVTDAQKHRSIMALKNNQDQYQLFEFDWQAMKISRQQDLAGRPKSMRWLANDMLELQLAQSSNLNDTSSYSYQDDYYLLNSEDMTFISSPLKGLSGKKLHYAPNHQYVFKSDLGVLSIRDLQSDLVYEKRRSESDDLIAVPAQWLDDQRLLFARHDGALMLLQLNATLAIQSLALEDCCAESIDADVGLVRGFANHFYQLDSDLQSTLLFKSERRLTQGYSFAEQGKLLIKQSEISGDGNSFAEFSLIDLNKNSVDWQIRLDDYDVTPVQSWLLTEQSEQHKLIHLSDSHLTLTIDNLPHQVAVMADESGQSIYRATFQADYLGGDNQLHILKSDRNDPAKRQEILFAIDSWSVMDSLQFFPQQNLALVMQVGDHAKRKAMELDLITGEIRQLAELELSSGFAPPLAQWHENYWLFSGSDFSGVLNYQLIERSSKRSLMPKQGERWVVHPALLKQHKVLSVNVHEQNMRLFDLQNQSSATVDCPMSYEAQIEHFPAMNVYLILTGHACFIAQDNLNLLRVIAPPHRDAFDATLGQAGQSRITAAIKGDNASLYLLTADNRAIEVTMNPSWQSQWDKADGLLDDFKVAPEQ